MPRQKNLRIEDVAREAGVSPITVSRALGNPGRVSDATRVKVKAAAEKIGYVVNNFASSLKSGRSSIVAVFVSSLQNPHFANAVQGIQDAFEGSRYHLLMAQTSYSETLETEMVGSVLPFRPAAVMFTGMVQSERTRVRLHGLGIPVMEMWDFAPDPIDMLVGFSNAEGGRLMGEHFGARGFRNIAYVGRTRDRGAQRLSGFRAGLRKFGKKPQFVLPLNGPRTRADGERALDAVRASFPRCDAIFFATDILAVGAAFRARELGLAIPAQLALAGFGDLDVSRQLPAPLTTIQVSGYEMGVAAGKMLSRRLAGEVVDPAVVRFPVTLAVRASTSG
jgi:LacI family transcriptional regulator, gluconate utilization system Gnt-I transcriptional repressor